MKVPASGFSQEGLGRMFGIAPTRPPPKPAHNRNAIIAGTVCDVAVFLILLALGFYIKTWRKRHAVHQDPIHEKGVLPDLREGGEMSHSDNSEQSNGREIEERILTPVELPMPIPEIMDHRS